MSENTSTASVPTDRAARYAKQLTDHMSRKVTTAWDAEAGTGSIDFDGATAVVSVGPTALDFALSAGSPELLDRFERVIGIHLVRFGRRDELVCAWTRADGSPATTQTVADLGD